MKNKRNITFGLFILGFVAFFMLFTGNQLTIAKEDQELLTIAKIIQSENIDIHGWSLHAREKRDDFKSLEDVQDHVKNLKNQFSSWKWTIASDDEKWEARATIQTSTGNQESIQVLSTLTNQKPQTYIIYEAKGQNFDQKTEHFIREDLNGTIFDIFRGNATIFSCIQGEINDKMDTDLSNSVNDVLHAFQATELESLQEGNFISTSAYSPLFSKGIKDNGNAMNLQVGVRNQGLGGKTTLVVGTPIITIEY